MEPTSIRHNPNIFPLPPPQKFPDPLYPLPRTMSHKILVNRRRRTLDDKLAPSPAPWGMILPEIEIMFFLKKLTESGEEGGKLIWRARENEL